MMRPRSATRAVASHALALILLGSLLAMLLWVPCADAAARAVVVDRSRSQPHQSAPHEETGGKLREGQGAIVLMARNLGAGLASGATGDPIVISDVLPAGLEATAISSAGTCSLSELKCTFTSVLHPYEQLTMTIRVRVKEPAGTVTTLPDEMRIEGGGAERPASRTQALTISGTTTPFGVQQQTYQFEPYEQDGEPATQAGSHPFQLTTTLVLNQTGTPEAREPVALPQNLRFRLPLGLVGDAQATEQCTLSNFTAHEPVSEVDLCPPGSVVGVASVTIDEPEVRHVTTLPVPVFNLVPSPGRARPLRFRRAGARARRHRHLGEPGR